MSEILLEDVTANTRGFEVTEEQVNSKSSWKNLKIRGIFQRADTKNHNGRIYPFSVLSKALSEAKESLESRNMFGELDHPKDQSPTVQLKNVSHVITNLRFMGNDLLGEAIVFDDPGPAGTPSGRLLGALIRNNCTVGISSRGLGALDKSNYDNDVVQEFKLVTFDCVQDPSTQQAYVQAIAEGRHNGDAIKNALQNKQIIKYLQSEIKSIVNNR